MNPYRIQLKNKYEVWIYGILFISAILTALLAVINIKISPDSMVYGLISQEILSGNGIRLPLIRLEDNYVFNDGTIPYFGEPPLLPILFALLGGVSHQNLLAAQVINIISHVLIAIFTFLLMKRIQNNSGIALLTGILVSTSIPLLTVTHHVWSETLFIALTVAAIYFLSRYSDRSRCNRNLFVASICISAAVLTRFAGIALIPMFFWGIIILVKNKSIKLNRLSSVLIVLLPILTTGALFLGTYIISGSIFGEKPPSPDRSYLSAFTGTIQMIFLQFHLGERPIALITIFSVLFILFSVINTNAQRELLKLFHSGLDLIIVFIISYTALISLAMATSQTVFELRYMSPLVPLLFILCVIIIIAVWKMVRLKGFSKLSLCGVILSLGIVTFGNCYKSYLHSGEFFYKQVRQYLILSSPTYNWIKENYGDHVIITSNKPHHLSFFGGYSTVRLPHRRFNKNYSIPDDMESVLPDRMARLGSRVLALFEKVEAQYEGSYLEELFNKRKDNDEFVLIQKFSDGVVYHLKE